MTRPTPAKSRRRVHPVWIIAGAIVLFLFVRMAYAEFIGEPDTAPSAPSTPSTQPVPSYVAAEDGRRIQVEVRSLPSEDGLRAIFDDVRRVDRPDGGYFVQINCAAAGAGLTGKRLANGRFAVGQLGAAQTGLQPGQGELELRPEQSCP